MKGYLSVFTITTLLIASFGMAPAFGQTVSPITVETNLSSYLEGQKVIISGTVDSIFEGFPVTILVKSPVGNLVSIDQVSVDVTTKQYSSEVVAGGSLMAAGGTYTIEVHYGSLEKTTTFEFEGSSDTISGNIAIDDSRDMIGYEITNGVMESIEPDVESNSLLVDIQSTDDGFVIFKIPRTLFDAQVDGQDGKVMVYVDGKKVTFDEKTTSKDRTITVSFPDGAQEIEIVGTFVVPEFGTIAAMILAVAIISIIAVSARSRLSIMPKI